MNVKLFFEKFLQLLIGDVQMILCCVVVYGNTRPILIESMSVTGLLFRKENLNQAPAYKPPTEDKYKENQETVVHRLKVAKKICPNPYLE